MKKRVVDSWQERLRSFSYGKPRIGSPIKKFICWSIFLACVGTIFSLSFNESLLPPKASAPSVHSKSPPAPGSPKGEISRHATENRRASSQHSTPQIRSKPPISLPVLDPPSSGTIRKHTKEMVAYPDTNMAPFEIKTSTGGNYLVKLENSLSGKNIMDIFVHGGDTIEVSVPLGKYVVKYAVGDIWYGYDCMFGPDTKKAWPSSCMCQHSHDCKIGLSTRAASYNKAGSSFHFKRDGNRISGYTITLYQVLHGNLSTHPIDASKF